MAGADRRRALGRLIAVPAWVLASASGAARAADTAPVPAAVRQALRQGGVALAFRHARAPGTFDPPGMRLDRCETQRNLDAGGRAQARALGVALRAAGLQPARVRSSPWCRCLDTARLAFGEAEAWDALGSPADQDAAWRGRALGDLRAGLAAIAPGRFEAWSTHMFVLADLTGLNLAPAEALVLQAPPAGGGAVRVLARWGVPD
jgi:hypothetical protein